jgi:hypothetical protein
VGRRGSAGGMGGTRPAARSSLLCTGLGRLTGLARLQKIERRRVLAGTDGGGGDEDLAQG